jgi:hypothetical protein
VCSVSPETAPRAVDLSWKFGVFGTLSSFLEVFGFESISGEEGKFVRLVEGFKIVSSVHPAATGHRRPPAGPPAAAACRRGRPSCAATGAALISPFLSLEFLRSESKGGANEGKW